MLVIPIAGIYFHIFEILLFLLLMLYFPAILTFKGTRILLEKSILLKIFIYSLFGFFFSIILSSINAINRLLVLKCFLKWVEIFLLSLLIFLYIRNYKNFKNIYWLLFLSSFGFLLIPITEIIIGKKSAFDYRIFPGYEAVFSLSLLLPFTNRKKILAIFIILICFLSIFLSLSRGAWIASLLCIFLFLRGTKLKYKLAVISGAILIVLALLSITQINELVKLKLYSAFLSESASNIERLVMIKVAIKAFLNNPITGIGGLNFPAFLITSGYTNILHSANVWRLSPHNYFLQIATEEGILGLVAFTTMISTLFFIVFKVSAVPMFNKSFTFYLIGLRLFCICFLFNLLLGYIATQFRFFFCVFIGLTLSLLRLMVVRMQASESQ